LESEGINTEDWLKSASLTVQDIIEDSAMLQYRVYEGLILRAMNLDKHADLGLRLGERLPVNTHGALGFALLNCTTLNDVLDMFSRYLSTRTPLLKLTMTQESGAVRLDLIELYDIEPIRRCFLEAVVMSVSNILYFVFNQKGLLQRVRFPFSPPQYIESYQLKLECPVEFNNSHTVLWLDNVRFQQPLKNVDRHSLHQATKMCDLELEKMGQLQSIEAQVRLLLLNSRSEFMSLEQIAQRLSMTTRTLHRKLAKEQQNYQAILQDVRFTLAKQYLMNQTNSIKQVAYMLGYEDVANFRRAFKRWQGESPQQYRLNLQREHD
jgi:AraC-like DNA-binding protein